MLHPEIYEIIRYIRSKRIMAGLITNGRALTEKNIQRLNDAGLQDLQISVDNVNPDEVSEKSLSFYQSKGILESLARLARFDVNLNSVIGSELEHPEDAWQITQRAAELGFGSTVGIIHDGDGIIKELKGREKEIYDQIIEVSAKSRFQFGYYSNGFQSELLEKGTSPWRCRAGARYLYICEHGRVQWCSQHRVCKDDKKHGAPIANDLMLDIPLKDYSWEEFDRQYYAEKWCAPKCTIQCVRLVGLLDKWRGPQSSFEKYSSNNN